MKTLLVLYILTTPPYDWSSFAMGDYQSCAEVAAALNADKPFERNNQPYYSCEKR